jgi:Flp pilus assembly protein TadD
MHELKVTNYRRRVSMRFASKLPLLIIAILFAIPAFAQTGNITGKAIDREGKPRVGLTVQIERQGIAGKFETKTDKNGAFIYRVPSGKYKVTLVQDGRPIDFIDGITVTSNANVPADFDETKQPATGGDSEARAKVEAEKAKQEAVKASFDQGIAALSAKNYPDAVRLFQEAAEKDPTKDVIFGQLGMALDGAKKYDDAAAAYRKAIELKATEPAYYNNLGVALGNAGKIDEAVQALQKSAELNPAGAAQSYFNLGAVLTNRGRTKDAGDAFKKAIEYDPNMAPAYYQLGISYFGSPATMAEAVPVLQKFLQLEPNGQDAEAAKQLIAAAQQAAPTAYKSEKAIAEEKAAAEKAEKAAAEKAAKEKAQQNKQKAR